MLEDILAWCDSVIEDYGVSDEDVMKLQEILNDISDEDMTGTEYAEEDITEEE